MSEFEFLKEFKSKYDITKFDKKHSYDYGYEHPKIIKINNHNVGCIAFNQFKNLQTPAIQIVYFFIYKQENGTGSLILKDLCDIADKHGVLLELDAIPKKNSISFEKLTAWYKKHGFNIVIKGDNLMRRKPRIIENEKLHS